MGKLKLNLDEIKVESFETNSTIPQVGTVNGQVMQGCTEGLNEDSCRGGGGGGNPTYETYCGTCPNVTCAMTCGNSWCESCVLPCPTMENTCPASCYTKCMCG